jgi:hypothetical protein
VYSSLNILLRNANTAKGSKEVPLSIFFVSEQPEIVSSEHISFPGGQSKDVELSPKELY